MKWLIGLVDWLFDSCNYLYSSYRLVLSNGLVNYQRIDHVLVKGVKKPIQQGYFTVPSQYGTREIYQTTYYRADKSGYHVYKSNYLMIIYGINKENFKYCFLWYLLAVQSPRNPAYDVYLQYTKDQENKIKEWKKNWIAVMKQLKIYKMENLF